MTVAIEEVRKWLILGGIGHVLVQSYSGWHYSPHNMTPNGEVVEDTPKRICRKCRAALKTATMRESVA